MSQSMVTAIRKLGPGDSDAYRGIRLESLKAHPEAFGSSYEAQVKLPRLMFEAALENPADNRFLVGAFDKGTLVGICGFVPGVSDDFKGIAQAGTLIQMYVRPAYRGMGVGLRLVEALVKEAFKDPQIKNVVLGVREGNTAAMRVYEKAGFYEYRPTEGEVPPGFRQMVIRNY